MLEPSFLNTVKKFFFVKDGERGALMQENVYSSLNKKLL